MSLILHPRDRTFKLYRWLGNIPNPREKDVDSFHGFLMLGCVGAIYVLWYDNTMQEVRYFLRKKGLCISPTFHGCCPFPSSHYQGITRIWVAQRQDNSRSMRRPVLWENLWVKIYEWCKCFAFYMWGFCLCMQHCAWNVCIKWNAVMWNWCKTKHNHLNHPQFRHLVISMAWYNWKLQKKVVWPKCTQVEGIYIQLNYHLTLCLSQGGS